MASFLKKCCVFASPFLAVGLSFVLLDPFMVVFSYDSFESFNPIMLNMDYVSTEMYLRGRAEAGYDSFIFGNSRTLALRTEDWRACIGEGVPLRYSAHGESVYGVWAKVKLIDSLGDRIRNSLILVDDQFLRAADNPRQHLYIKHPRLSGESWLDFYSVFAIAYFRDLFFLKYFDYTLFNVYRPYMKDVINAERMRVDPFTNDLYMESLDERLAEDSGSYYREKAKLFSSYRRKQQERDRGASPAIRGRQRGFLEEIRAVFADHRTRYTVIVSPNYHQLSLNGKDKEELTRIFGAANVFDYSGVNEITSDIRNYYEPRHFRPHVGRMILGEVCTEAGDGGGRT